MGRFNFGSCQSNIAPTVYNHVGYWWESQKESDHWEEKDVGGWTILRWFSDRMGWYGLD
jgi:hypothetical protein